MDLILIGKHIDCILVTKDTDIKECPSLKVDNITAEKSPFTERKAFSN